MNRRQFLKNSAAVGLLWGLPPSLVRAASGPIHQLTLRELSQALASGRLTPAAVLDAYLERVEAHDRQVRAIVELAPRSRLVTRQESGPLAHLPLLIKDNIATGDGLVNAAGSLALASSKPTFTAPVAERLRAAGAILMGKANMSEWAACRSDNCSAGWSGRGGQTRNPHALDRSPAGSSAGSAAAVAAGFAAAALGTETNGSITLPAAICGVVGLKPTAGTLSGEGIIPIAETQDTAGPIGRCVQDVAWLFDLLTGKDSAALDPSSLRGARLGVARNQFGFDGRVDALMEEQLKVLSRMGATLIDPIKAPDAKDYASMALDILLYELKDGVEAYLRRLGPDAPVKTLADVIAFNQAHTAEEKLAYYDQNVLIKANAKGPLSEPAYLKARREVTRLARDEGLARLLQEQRLDAIVAPTNGPSWLIDEINGDHFKGGSSSPAAIAGLPHITVPAGAVLGLPIGLSFYGPAKTEVRLLNLAYAFEQTTRARFEPNFPATL